MEAEAAEYGLDEAAAASAAEMASLGLPTTFGRSGKQIGATGGRGGKGGRGEHSPPSALRACAGPPLRTPSAARA